jgi:hypothetical protein
MNSTAVIARKVSPPAEVVRMNWLAELLRWPTVDQLIADMRHSWRGMQRSPGFYSIAVLMLALGIGINGAIFSVFAHVLLSPLRFPDPGNLYVVTSHAASLGDARRPGLRAGL